MKRLIVFSIVLVFFFACIPSPLEFEKDTHKDTTGTADSALTVTSPILATPP